tara:strand:+ start:4091 stop:4633 length:543 start_codon:yes stop_codon:yes gene_type:complete
MDRRDFLKALGVLASMPMMSKLKFLQKEPVREGIASVADKGVEFYEAVIGKVMREGKKISESDRIETFVHPDRPDIKVEFDRSTGSSNVEFMTDRDTKGLAEIKVTMDEGTKGVPVKELEELEEVYTEVGKDADGLRSPVSNLDEFLGRKKKKDGGIMELTIMQIPDIEVSGVESLFKSR